MSIVRKSHECVCFLYNEAHRNAFLATLPPHSFGLDVIAVRLVATIDARESVLYAIAPKKLGGGRVSFEGSEGIENMSLRPHWFRREVLVSENFHLAKIPQSTCVPSDFHQFSAKSSSTELPLEKGVL